jgi:hypothetical protein
MRGDDRGRRFRDRLFEARDATRSVPVSPGRKSACWSPRRLGNTRLIDNLQV